MNSYPPLQANVPRQFAQQPAKASAPLSPSTAWAPQPAAPRPIIRAKGPDEPAPSVAMQAQVATPLTMPTPEQLGVRSSVAAMNGNRDLDLTAAYQRLENLGAVCFRMDKLDTGDSRFTCLLPTRQAGVNHRVEADASSPAEAIRSVLTQAEDWAKTGK
jgi:hypothetical protein